MGAMASGEWESLVGLVIAPGLEEAAAELNGKPGIVAEVSEHPFDDACVLWIGRREPASGFVAPHGAFAIHDEPVLPMIRVEEADPRVSSGRPVVSVYLRRSELSVASIKGLAVAFADRLPAVEWPGSEAEPRTASAGSAAIAEADQLPMSPVSADRFAKEATSGQDLA